MKKAILAALLVSALGSLQAYAKPGVNTTIDNCLDAGGVWFRFGEGGACSFRVQPSLCQRFYFDGDGGYQGSGYVGC